MNVLSSLGVPASPIDSLTGMIESSPYAFAISIASIVVSLLLCFFGYRLLKVFCAAGSFLAGGLLCAWLVSSLFSGAVIPEDKLPIAAGISFLIGGLLFAYVLFFLYKLVVFVLFAGIGMAVASVPVVAFELSGWAMLGTLAGCAVLFGLAGLLFMRPLIILVTACSGFSAASGLIALTPLGAMDYASIAVIVLGAVLTVLGAIVQFRLSPSGTLPGFKKAKKADQTETAEDGSSEESASKKQRRRKKDADIVNNDAEYLVREGVTTPAEFFGASLRRSALLRPLMKIAPALLLLVCVLLALSGNPHVEFALLPFILAYAAQSFGVLTLSSAVLFARSVPSLIHAMDAGDMMSTAFCGVSALVYLILMLWALVSFISHKTGKEFVARLAPSEPPADAVSNELYDSPVRPEDEPTAILPNDLPTAPAEDESLSMPAETPTAPTSLVMEDLLAELSAAVQAQMPEERADARTAPIHLNDEPLQPPQEDTTVPESAAPVSEDTAVFGGTAHIPQPESAPEETLVIPSEQETAPIQTPEDTITMPLAQPSAPEETVTMPLTDPKSDSEDETPEEPGDDTIVLGNPADLK